MSNVGMTLITEYSLPFPSLHFCIPTRPSAKNTVEDHTPNYRPQMRDSSKASQLAVSDRPMDGIHGFLLATALQEVPKIGTSSSSSLIAAGIRLASGKSEVWHCKSYGCLACLSFDSRAMAILDALLKKGLCCTKDSTMT